MGSHGLTMFCAMFLQDMASECNQCVLLKSWDSCKNNSRGVTCSSGVDRCVKAHVEDKVNGLSLAMYAKGCAESADCTEDGCKKLPQDPRMEITMCKY